MSHYQSLARKFRPQCFADVCQQEAIIQTLKSAIELKRVSHAYLFCGTRGTGKTTLARIFAKALNCKNLKEDFEPCNECSSCKEITHSSSLDVIEIDGASHRGIDDIRKLNETTMYTPSSAQYRIYIIDEVHMLTKEAFNALLKTLEEPPENVKFFFATTEPHKVLPTIMSRVQRFDLRRISTEGIIEKLKKILSSVEAKMTDDALFALAKVAEGSLRDAESLLDQVLCTNKQEIKYQDVAAILGFCSLDALFLLDEAVSNCDLSYAFELTKELYDSGKDFGHFLTSLLDHFKTILQIKIGAKNLKLSSSDFATYQTVAKSYTQAQCLSLLEYLMNWMQTFKQHEIRPSHLEMLLLHIIRSSKRIYPEELVQRVEALSEGSSIAAPTEKVDPLPEPPALTKAPEVEQSPTAKEASSQAEDQTALAAETPALKEPPTRELPKDLDKLQSYETLIRFASVELNGIVKKR